MNVQLLATHLAADRAAELRAEARQRQLVALARAAWVACCGEGGPLHRFFEWLGLLGPARPACSPR